MIRHATDVSARDDEAAFRQDHPILWWMTLAAPFAITALVLFMVWELAGANRFWRLVSTALAAFFFLGKFAILGGSEGTLLDSREFFTAEQLVAIVLYMDFMTSLVLTSHLGFLFGLPVIGAQLRSLAGEGEFILHSNPWMKRATYLGLVAFVMFPLAATGSVGGAIFGRLLGMSRLATFNCLAIGNILGCALMYFVSELFTKYVGRDNPWLSIGGILVVGAILLLLNYRYRQLKARKLAAQRTGGSTDICDEDKRDILDTSR
jgi:Putative small multi-drug export protein